MAAEGVVQLPPDSTGKSLRTREVTVGATTVEQEVVTLADPDGNLWTSVPVVQPEILSTLNTFTVGPGTGTAKVSGVFELTRATGIIRGTTVVNSNVTSGLGATFEFEYSEDGIIGDDTVDETRPITSFSSLRDFDLKNFGRYFKVNLTPSRALVGAERIYVETQFDTQYSGPFVRLADQVVERQNAAFGETFAYLKGFGGDGLSKNVVIQPDGSVPVSASPVTVRVDYDASSRAIYIGKAMPGASDSSGASTDWTLFKLAYTGINQSPDSVKYATGAAWANRATTVVYT